MANKYDYPTIKAAVLNNRGGLENANPTEIMIIWNSLSEKVQAIYVETVNNANSDRPQPKSTSNTADRRK